MSKSQSNPLDARCVRHCGCITLWKDKETDIFLPNNDFDYLKKTLLAFFNSSDTIVHYYFIFHNDDYSNLHCHYIITYDRQVRLSTTLNKLSTFLGFDTNQIKVERLTSLNAFLRYFLHLDEELDKKRYEITDIFSDENITRLQDYIDSEDEVLSVPRLISLVLTYANEVDIMNYLGLPTYHKYRYEIRMLYENTTYLAMKYPHLKPDFKFGAKNDLPF